MKYGIATVINIDQCGIMLNKYISYCIVVEYILKFILFELQVISL